MSLTPESRLQHLDPILPQADNPALVPAIQRSVKYTFANYEEFEAAIQKRRPGYFYSRVANPTVRQLENTLAELQGREAAIALGSGVAALSACLISLLKPGDQVLLFWESYMPTRYLVRNLMAKFGVRARLFSILDIARWEEFIRDEKPRLVLFESPTNPILRLTDLARVTAAARASGSLTILDNTFGGIHQHGDYDIDLYVHSLTKYVGGHGDLTAGAIIGSKALIESLHKDSFEIGAALDPEAAFLALRGLKTYFLRFRRQSETALRLAQALEQNPRIAAVHYPGLDSHPQNQLARSQMKEFGGVLSVTLQGGANQVPALIDRLRLFRLATSLGSTESLVAPIPLCFATDLSAEEKRRAGISDSAVRFSIGLEDSADLLADLNQALAGLTH